jgi:nicotinamide-nucleotide amidase
MVSYSNESKAELLGVDAKLIEEHGAASPEVAEAMADGALSRFDADVACSTTGVAGPDGGSEEKPVGYVAFCAKTAAGQKLARDVVLPGSRNDVRERSVVVAMHLVRYLLEGREPPR